MVLGAIALGAHLAAVQAGGVMAAQVDGELTTCADADCFIQQAQDCSAADWVDTTELDLTPLAPVIQTTTTAYHLEPADDGSCTFAVQYPANQVRYTDDYVAQALAQGMSPADLDAARARLTQQGQLVTKLHITCSFAPTEIVALLMRWQAGSFSSNDLGAPSCAQQSD